VSSSEQPECNPSQFVDSSTNCTNAVQSVTVSALTLVHSRQIEEAGNSSNILLRISDGKRTAVPLHVMKAWFHSFLISSPHGIKLLPSHSGRFTYGTEPYRYTLNSRLSGHESRSGILESDKKISPLPKIESRAVQFVV
jgi:hypothetical protein